MTPYAIGAIVSAAAAGGALTLASLGVSLIWRLHASRLSSLAPQHRARVVAALRLSPAVGASIVGAVVLTAFIRLEPAETREVLGVLLPLAAAVTVTAFGWRFACGYRALARTRRAVASWAPQPDVVDSAFPIVAVVGIWRPRFYVARRVVESCDRDELSAIIAHEAAHVRAGDNLTRFCFACTPFFASKTARSLERTWLRASEEAADDAACTDQRSALALASALTKVARLAAGQAMPRLQASAVYSGSVEERVRRLFEKRSGPAEAGSVWRYAVVLAAAIPALWSPAALLQIYNAAEYCVRHLP